MTPLAGAVLTPPRLLLAGDDVADWPALGAHVADTFALPGGSERLASIDEIDRALRDGPSARLIYFAARPERALLAGPADDLDATLDRWALRARAVLRLAHAHPGRYLLVDLDDALAHPADLLAGVADWLELAHPAPAPALHQAPAPAPDDALWRLAASASVATREPIVALALEWIGSCIPLGPASALAAVPKADDALAALARQRGELARVSAALQQAATERDALSRQSEERSVWAHELEQQVRQLEESLGSLDHEHARRGDELRTTREALRQAESDVVLLRTQVDQLLEASEAEATRAAAAVAELQALRAEHQGLMAAAGHERDEALAAMRALEARVVELETGRAASAAAADELMALRAEHEALMAQLLLARSEAAASQALSGDTGAVAANGPTELPLPLAGISLVHVRDEPPHRELQFQLLGVVTPHGELPALDLRLVDHHGRPGLVILGGPGADPIAGWRPTAEEGGRPLMLIVPSDAAGVRALEPLPSADWAFVRGLAELLCLATAEPDFEVPGHWRQLARRLLTQLDRLPRRLRYDRLDVHPPAGDGAVDVVLDGVTYGPEALPPVTLRWRAGGRGGTPAQGVLAWCRPEDPDAAPPLALWPELPDGNPAPALVFPLGAGFSAEARRRWWSAHPDADRQLLLSLLDTLPAAAEAAGQPAWRVEAESLRNQAQSTLRSLRLRRLAGRLRRR